jgi:serine acetyltransferase
MPGVTVGNGAIIGSNAVVTKDVADFAIAVGVPARTIKQRFSDDVASRLDAMAWWDWTHDKLHRALWGARVHHEPGHFLRTAVRALRP